MEKNSPSKIHIASDIDPLRTECGRIKEDLIVVTFDEGSADVVGPHSELCKVCHSSRKRRYG